jgi:hypothetical protein
VRTTFLCIVDALTSASMLPGIEVIIEELAERVVFADHGRKNDMSRISHARPKFNFFDDYRLVM